MHPDVAEYELHPGIIITVGAVMLLLAGIALSMRLYLRGFVTRSIGWDDRLLVVAFLLYTAYCGGLFALGNVLMVDGIASDLAMAKLARLSISGTSLWNLTEICIKISAAIFFLRIVIEQWQRRIILASITIYVCFTTTVIFINLFQCGTLENLFHHRNCLDWATVMGPIGYVGGAMDTAVDWIFVTTTVSLIFTTRMPIRAKVSVCFILCVAAMGSIVAIARIPFIRGGRVRAGQAEKLPKVVSLACIESGLSIVALSLATLRPLFRSWIDAFTSKHGSSSDDVERQGSTPPPQRQRAGAMAAPNDDVEITAVGPKRKDSGFPIITTITTPTELSGHYGVLDSFYSIGPKDER